MAVSNPHVCAYVHTHGADFDLKLDTLIVQGVGPREYLYLGDCCVILDTEGLERLRAVISDHLGTKAAAELRAEAEAKSARAAA